MIAAKVRKAMYLCARLYVQTLFFDPKIQRNK